MTQFCGAFNDNLFKNALVILSAFRLADRYGLNAMVLITVIAGLFILPFFLFSATAGQLADKYEKSFLIRLTKITEIILMLLTAWAFETENLWALIALLFFMGAQSAFFGPLKYSILPQHLRRDELVAGNGLVNAGTYLAILLGTLCGGLLVLAQPGRIFIAVGVVAVAAAGYIASLFIPKAPATAPGLKIDFNIPRAAFDMLSFVFPYKTVFRSALGIAWFWLVGSVVLAQFATLAKDVLGGNQEVLTLFMIFFSLGVGLGSTLCHKLLRGEITARLVPVGCIGMSAAIALLYIFSLSAETAEVLAGAADFARRPRSWGIMLSLVMLAASGGIFSVPLYAVLQSESPAAHRARIVACANILDSLAMVLGAVFTTLLLLMRVSVMNIYLIIALINLIITPVLTKMTRGGREDGNGS